MKLGKLRIPIPGRAVSALVGAALAWGAAQAASSLPQFTLSSIHPQIAASAAAVSPDSQDSGEFHEYMGPSQADTSLPPGFYYSELDGLGRAGKASACITGQMRAQARGADRSGEDLKSITPSGWPRENPQVELEFADGQEYSGRLWNRSHLIAFSLGGATDARNIVAGTRAQNVGSNSSASPDGMAYTESLARDWLDSHPDGWLWYSAEPVYSGDEPICREVVVDLRSDDGTLDMRVRVPNAAPEVDIDYSGGTRTCALE